MLALSKKLSIIIATTLVASCGSSGSSDTPTQKINTDITVAASVSSGAYISSQAVELICADGNVNTCDSVYYTNDGSVPTVNTNLYVSALNINDNTTLKFIAIDTDSNESAVQTEVYIIDSSAPVTTPSVLSGIYNAVQTVSLACDDGSGSGCGASYYTVDGDIPTSSSSVYQSALTIADNTTLKFYSVDNLGNEESVLTLDYVVDNVSPTVSASVLGGAYNSVQSVALTCSDVGQGCANIFYTTDGSEPTTSSAVYSSVLVITNSSMLKYIASDLANNVSVAVSQDYIIDTVAPTTTASIQGGAYNQSQIVSLTCGDAAGSGCGNIYYTLDGTNPGINSSVYSTSLSITPSATLKYFAVDNLSNTEVTKTEIYILDTTLPEAVFTLPAGNNALIPGSTALVAVRATDANGISSVTVNGVTAEQVVADNIWRADIPLSPGDNVVSVTVTDNATNTRINAATTTIESNYVFERPTAITYDEVGKRLLMATGYSGLLEYAPSRSYLQQVASGALAWGTSIYIQQGTNEVYYAEGAVNNIFHVDVTTGVRTAISSDRDGLGDDYGYIYDFVIDPDGLTGYVLDRTGVLNLTLSSSVRSLFSGSSDVSKGPSISSSPDALLYDDVSGELILFDGKNIMSVNKVTGNRVTIATGTGFFVAAVKNNTTGEIYCIDAAGDIYIFDRQAVTLTLFYENTGVFTTTIVDLALDTDINQLYVATYQSGMGSTLISIDMASKLATEFDQNPDTDITLTRSGNIDFSQNRDSLFVAKPEDSSILEIDMVTGTRTVVADSITGTGVTLSGLRDLEYKDEESKLYIADGQQLVTMNSSGLRELVSSTSVPVGVTVTRYDRVSIDSANKKAFVSTGRVIYEINLVNGSARIIADSSVGSGETITGTIKDINFDPVSGMLFYLEQRKLVSLDVVTLVRTAVITTGLTWAENIYVDGAKDEIYIVDSFQEHVAYLDLTTSILRPIVTPYFDNVLGVAYDPIRNNVIYFDSQESSIWTLNMDIEAAAVMSY